MFDFYERRRLKQLLYSPIVILILVVLVALLGRATWGVYQQERETAVRLDQQQVRLIELKNRGESLKEEIDLLSTERGIESELRQKYEVAREGEEVIVIVDAPKTSQASAVEAPKNLWDKLLDFIF